MNKIVTISKHITNKEREMFQYPELDDFLNDGYELVDMLPGTMVGNHYVLTFILNKREPRKAARRQPAGKKSKGR